MNSKYRYLIPNGITFASLICGVLSLLMAATGRLEAAGILILCSYVLDLFDGSLARRLNAGSSFGLQLDSLVDMVSLGTAPAVLAFMHLQQRGLPEAVIWPLVVLSPIAGAFRLARFNLLPAKTGSSDSLGLTISTGGATITLAVLSDLALPSPFLPAWAYVVLLVLVSLLMVSTIRFPPFTWVFGSKKRSAAVLGLVGVSLFLVPFVQAWFLFTNGYLSVSLVRARLLRGRAA